MTAALRFAERYLEDFCQQGANSGMPGPCPEVASGKAAARTARVAKVGTAAGKAAASAAAGHILDPAARQEAGGKAAAAAGKVARKAARKGQSLGRRVTAGAKRVAGPELRRDVKHLVATVKGAVHKIEHKLESYYKAGQEIAKQVARERSTTPEQKAQVDKVGRYVGIADAAARWTTNVPLVDLGLEHLAGIGGPVGFLAAKTGFYTPVASLGWLAKNLAMHTLRGGNPLKLLMAAHKAIKGAPTVATPAGGAAVPSHHAEGDDDRKKTVARLLARFARLHEGPPAEAQWYEALLSTAIDKHRGDLPAAMTAADAAFEKQSTPPATGGAADQCEEGENKGKPGPCPGADSGSTADAGSPAAAAPTTPPVHAGTKLTAGLNPAGWPKETTLGDLEQLARKKLGASFHKVVVRHYRGSGSQVEVLAVKNGYHGKEIVRKAVYPLPDAPAAPHAERFSEGARIPWTDVFAAGTRRGQGYSSQDLHDMAANFRRWSSGKTPVLRVPAVLGHEESQEYLERTDLPAAAWADGARVALKRCPICGGSGKTDRGARCPECRGQGERQVLQVKFGEVPGKVARLVRGKAYRTVSAEVYPEPPEGIPVGTGKMLRRVAFLGGELPQLKGLDDIPAVEEHSERRGPYRPVLLRFAETRYRRSRAGTWLTFTEARHMPDDYLEGAANKAMWAKVSAAGKGARVDPSKGDKSGHYKKDRMAGEWAEDGTMDRDGMMQALAEHGLDMEAVKDVPDPALAEMLRVCEAKDDAAHAEDEEKTDVPPPEEEPPPDAPMAEGDEEEDDEDDEDDDDEPPPDRPMAEGEDDDEDDEFCDDDMHVEGDEDEVTTMAPVAAAPPARPMSARRPKKVQTTMHYSERAVKKVVKAAVTEAVKQVRKEFAGVREQTEQLSASQKRANVTAFCEAQLAAGKVMPAELDDQGGKRPTLIDRLLRADARQVVRKFTEKGKTVELTELDLQMKEIEERPVIVRYGERVKSSAGGRADGSGEGDEVEKVRAFAHRQEIVDALRANDQTPAQFVQKFCELRKARPDLTAAEFGAAG